MLYLWPLKNDQMKKIIFFLLFITAASLTYAQSLSSINDEIPTNVIKAKADIDKYLSNPKKASDAEGWYYKGRVYNEISKHDSLKVAGEDFKKEAFEAFKKYQELDPKNVLMLVTQNADLFDIYNGYFTLAVNAYNQKDYIGAFYNFKNSMDVSAYIKNKAFSYNGFVFPAFDTTLITDIAVSARAANDDSDAVTYYKKITDANIADSQYLPAYEFLTDYYSKKNDSANYEAALIKGKRLFPADQYWIAIQISGIESSGTKEEAIKKYDAAVGDEPSDYSLNYNYAVYLYNYLYGDKALPANIVVYKAKAVDQIKKTIAISPTAEANMLMGEFLYNTSIDYSEAASKIRRLTVSDVNKKRLLNDSSQINQDQAIIYVDTAVKLYEAQPELKGYDKGNYMRGLSILQTLYANKHEDAKAAVYEDKLKSVK
jgi:hypothetical protein